MRHSLLAATLLAGLCACNHAAPVSDAEKAKTMVELLSHDHTCDAYRTRLEAPGVDRAAIDSIYRSAAQAGCVRHDV
ncbi:MAG TPA: hypothetical protein VF801_12790 [Rhodocyclaceae bacterium]